MSGKNIENTKQEPVVTAEETVKEFFEWSSKWLYSIIEEYITHGYMSRLAHVVVYLPQDMRNGALAKLPDSVRNEVKGIVSSSADKTRTDSDVTDAVFEAVDLHKTDNDLFKDIPLLAKFAIVGFSKDPVIVELMSGSLCDVFENVILNVLDDAMVKKMLQETDIQELEKALKAAKAETNEKIISCMSKRAVLMFKEDMEFMGPIRLATAKKAQADILHEIWQLMVCGEIKFPVEEAEQVAQTEFAKVQESVLVLVEEYIDGGWLEKLALKLVYLPESRRKNTLAKMPCSIKTELENILVKMKDKRCTDIDVMKSVNTLFPKKKSKPLSDETYFYLNLHYDEYYAENPILMEYLGYFNFDRLMLKLLYERAVERLLREIDERILAVALKKSSTELQDKVFRNMSKRSAQMLRDDMQMIGELSLEDINAAQSKIVSVINRLIDEFVIYEDLLRVLSLSDDDVQYVE